MDESELTVQLTSFLCFYFQLHTFVSSPINGSFLQILLCLVSVSPIRFSNSFLCLVAPSLPSNDLNRDELCFDEFFDDGGCDCLPDGCVDEEPTDAPVAAPVSPPTTEAPVVSTAVPTKTPAAPTTPKPTDAPVESPVSVPGGEPTASPVGVPGRKPTPISGKLFVRGSPMAAESTGTVRLFSPLIVRM